MKFYDTNTELTLVNKNYKKKKKVTYKQDKNDRH